MKKSYSQKEQIIKQYEFGISITLIHQVTGISRSTLYKWISNHNTSSIRKKVLNQYNYQKLKMHCEKLENIIEILKTCGCTVDDSLHQRYEIIKELSSDYSITTLCDALNVPKGSYYNHIFRNKNDDTLAVKRLKELTHVVERVFNDSKQTFGASKITAIMNYQGYKTTEKTVPK